MSKIFTNIKTVSILTAAISRTAGPACIFCDNLFLSNFDMIDGRIVHYKYGRV